MVDVSLVIPVYNESASLERLVAQLRALVRAETAVREVILVDDGSGDGSGELAERLLAREWAIRLVRHERNRGYGAALKSGIAASRHEWIAIADADGTYPLKALARLVDRVDAGARMAVGARRLRDQPVARRPAKAFLNRFASYLTGAPIPDINSGLRLFRRDDALRLDHLLPDGFSFTTTITMALMGEGRRVDFVPIAYRERTGRSKIRPLRDMTNFLVLICRMALAFNPLKVFGPVGAAMLAAGAVLLLLRFLSPDRPFGLATTIVLWIGGLQLWAVGFLADLINRRS